MVRNVSLQPEDVLYDAQTALHFLPVCDHYAGSERFLAKALELQAEMGPVFDVTADCEDGAPVGAEAEHARMIARLAASPANRHGRLGLRIHDLRHPHWRADLDLVLAGAAGRLAYVVMPKVDDADAIDQVAAHLDRHRNGSAIPLHALIETHAGLRNVARIAAHPRIQCLSFGLLDFVSAHHGAIPASVLEGAGQFEHPLVRRAKLEIAAAAHAFGKVPSHSVSTALHDAGAVAADATRAHAEFGYTRMWSVHPDQIAPIVRALSPRHEDIGLAARVLGAAADASWGPVKIDGRLHDRASYRLFWSLLRRAAAAGVELPAGVARRFNLTTGDSAP
jgi:citrate lyase subunit beta / citryl-CoA lyase